MAAVGYKEKVVAVGAAPAEGIRAAKSELLKRKRELAPTPAGETYKLSGKWGLPEELGSDGAGGQNCTLGPCQEFRFRLVA